jgi:hypothetical protein
LSIAEFGNLLDKAIFSERVYFNREFAVAMDLTSVELLPDLNCIRKMFLAQKFMGRLLNKPDF